MTQSFWEGTFTHPIDNADETQKVDLLNALHQDLEKDPSFDGRFTKNRTLTRLGQANLIGLLIITAVLLAALFSWASVDFVLDGSSGEGCLSGLVTVFCAVFLLIGISWTIGDPTAVRLVYVDGTHGDVVCEQGLVTRAARHRGLVDGVDGIAEQPLSTLLEINPSLDGRFTVHRSWSVLFLVLMIIGAGVPLALGLSVYSVAVEEAANPVDIEKHLVCEAQYPSYVCEPMDDEFDDREYYGYCEDHTAIDGRWWCTTSFGSSADWVDSVNWSHLKNGTVPAPLSLDELKADALNDMLLGFEPQTFLAVVGVLTLLLAPLPMYLGLGLRRFQATDSQSGEVLGRHGYETAYATAIGSVCGVEAGLDASEGEILVQGVLAAGVGLTSKKSLLGSIFRSLK